MVIERGITKADAILSLLQRCRRQWYKPDLHSFKARVTNGVVFVECDTDGVDIHAIYYNEKGEEIRESWRTGRALRDAVDILYKLGIELDTVET